MSHLQSEMSLWPIKLHFRIFTPQSTEGQVKMFGKCCQLRPTGGSSSSLDSSSSCTSETRETKEQGLRFQVTHRHACKISLQLYVYPHSSVSRYTYITFVYFLYMQMTCAHNSRSSKSNLVSQEFIALQVKFLKICDTPLLSSPGFEVFVRCGNAGGNDVWLCGHEL